MSQQGDTRNNLSGNVEGPAVMARDIYGGVVFSGAPSLTSAVQTAKDQRRFSQYVRVQRWRRRLAVLLLLVGGATVVWEQMHGWTLPGRQQFVALFTLFAGGVGAITWARCTWIIKRAETGRTIKIPHSRLHW
ncbi:hypothetical protein ACWEFL_34735 [Streptomyces sp. NPDC004838]